MYWLSMKVTNQRMEHVVQLHNQQGAVYCWGKRKKKMEKVDEATNRHLLCLL